jgi:predicted nuclease with TOPRIM domain|tara:strand:- start:2350 stop:2592 length:243 start_codon:yes stop_codon:yes gene_type:complete
MSDEFEKELDKMRNELKKAENKNNELNEANDKLQDEVDSLWAMMDEMTKSDIENWTHLLDQLEADTAQRALMVTKKKADA